MVEKVNKSQNETMAKLVIKSDNNTGEQKKARMELVNKTH